MKTIYKTSCHKIVVTFLMMTFQCYPASAESSLIKVVPLKSLKKLDPSILQKIIHKPIKLHFNRFPLASSKNSTWEAPVLPKTFVLSIPKGKVFSDAGYVVIRGRYIVSELLWPWSPYKKGKKSLNLKNAGRPKYISGKVVVLAQEGHRNYYHWMLEILPKLALLKDIGPYDRIYLPRMDLPFQKQTLVMMGVDLDKVIEADPTTYIEANEIIVPSFVSRSCYTPHWVVDYLQERLNSKEPVDSQVKFGDKVFISRQKAAYRKIENEDEIFAYLEKLGFKRYHLEELNIEEQIQLFAHAKIVIAPHGAGLTNIIFCKPGTKILEIFQAHEDDTYCYLAQVLGLDYNGLKTTEFTKGGGYKNTVISPEQLQKFVNQSLKL